MSDPKKWTVMFYFAADNDLAPLVVSQLKAIKDAGYQKDTDVVVYFDPSEHGTPTCLYHVNKKRRERSRSGSDVGDDNDSFVRNMLEDDIDFKDLTSEAVIKMKLCLDDPDNTLAVDALGAFLDYCAEEHKAEHYILFMLGHGMIVGNDAFMPDEEPGSAISLKQLKKVMKDFKKKVGDAFELLALNSCSMSAIEVAYELRDTANYAMASEGVAFVGSWPYRQMLKNLFNALKKGEGDSPVDVAKLIEQLYFLAYHNAKDFRLAGYPLELSLISLASNKYKNLLEALGNLVPQLIEGVKNPADDKSQSTSPDKSQLTSQDKIQLAHLKSQSYYAENYTDLYDFCRCLAEKCSDTGVEGLMRKFSNAVMEELKPKRGDVLQRFESLVVHSKHFGGKYQYSHGLSIYFPWCRPYQRPKRQESNMPRVRNSFMKTYREYDFDQVLGKNAWADFLRAYFEETQRSTRKEEDKSDRDKEDSMRTENLQDKKSLAVKALESELLDLDVPTLLSGNEADIEKNWLVSVIDKPTGALERTPPDKSSGGTGPSCTCPAIKNYSKNVA